MNPHPHDQHAYQHEDHWHHILKDPGPSVAHKVQSPFVQQSVEVLEELCDSIVLINLQNEVNRRDVRRGEVNRRDLR